MLINDDMVGSGCAPQQIVYVTLDIDKGRYSGIRLHAATDCVCCTCCYCYVSFNIFI